MIRQYPFTEAGKQLYTLIGETTSNEDFIKYAELLSHNNSYQISVHHVKK